MGPCPRVEGGHKGCTSTAAAAVGPRPRRCAPSGCRSRARSGGRGSTPVPGGARSGPVGSVLGPHAVAEPCSGRSHGRRVRLRQLQGYACAGLSCSGSVQRPCLWVRTRARRRCGPRPEAAGPHGRGGRPAGSTGLLARLAHGWALARLHDGG
jgi:hypothetical protein